jgi:NitT/TauT family transport system substrate-binding protein
MELTYDPIQTSLYKSADDAIEIGFLDHGGPELSKIYDLDLLNEVLAEKGLEPVEKSPTA